MKRRFFIFSLMLVLGFANAQTVDQIKISGNNKTKEKYLQRFLSQEAGAEYDSLLVHEDERRLRTLSSVLGVEARLEVNDSLTVLTYDIKERWTLLPVGDFGATKDNFWVGAGLMESNFLGRGVYFYGYLQYKEPFAAHFIFRIPYFRGSRYGYELQYRNAEIPEKEEFVYSDLYKQHEISFAGRYEIAFEKDVYVGVACRDESYYLNSIEQGRKKSLRYYSKLSLQRMDYHRFMADGWQNFTNICLSDNLDQNNNSISLQNEIRYFKVIGKSNIATKYFLGVSTEEELIYLPFYADSYSNFRGSGYRSFRGNQTFLTNLEYRYTVIEGRFTGIQALAFSDLGWMGYKFNKTYLDEKFLAFAGPGLRVNIKQIYKATLSIDFGISLIEPNKNGWVIGWGQYF